MTDRARAHVRVGAFSLLELVIYRILPHTLRRADTREAPVAPLYKYIRYQPEKRAAYRRAGDKKCGGALLRRERRAKCARCTAFHRAMLRASAFCGVLHRKGGDDAVCLLYHVPSGGGGGGSIASQDKIRLLEKLAFGVSDKNNLSLTAVDHNIAPPLCFGIIFKLMIAPSLAILFSCRRKDEKNAGSDASLRFFSIMPFLFSRISCRARIWGASSFCRCAAARTAVCTATQARGV